MRIRYKIIPALFIALLGATSPLTAQEAQLNDTLPPVVRADVLPEVEMLPDVKIQPKTHPEKIVFTQIKLGKGQPDFDAFAKASPYVEQAQEIDKSAMILSEYNRIANAYSLHDQNGNIVVHTKIKANQYSSLQNMIVFDEFDDKTFFRFSMYGYNVGIVPDGIQKYSKLALSKARAERMFEHVAGANDVYAEFILKPITSDVREPFVFNDNSYWLMSARIAEFRLWSNDKPAHAQLLWFHREPWYTPSDNNGLQDLFVKE